MDSILTSKDAPPVPPLTKIGDKKGDEEMRAEADDAKNKSK